MFEDRQAELEQICKDHPIEIPIAVAAKWLGVSAESLRYSIIQGTCGFVALSWRKPGKSNAGYHIPTSVFYRAFSVK